MEMWRCHRKMKNMCAEKVSEKLEIWRCEDVRENEKCVWKKSVRKVGDLEMLEIH